MVAKYARAEPGSTAPGVSSLGLLLEQVQRQVLGCLAAAVVGWPGVTNDSAGDNNSQQNLLLT